MGSLRDLLDKQKAEKLAAEALANKKAEVKAADIAPAQVASTPAQTPIFTKPLSIAERIKARQSENASASTKVEAKVIPPAAPIPMVKAAPIPSPATAPATPANDLGEPELLDLKKNIAFLYSNMENIDLIGQVVRRIMEQVRRNPHFRPSVTSTDKEKIVEGFRKAYQSAARKKTEGREKKERKHLELDEISSMMKDMGLGDIEF